MSCLIFGRAEDYSVKGLDIAAKAMLEACHSGSQLLRDAVLSTVPGHGAGGRYRLY